MDWVKVTAIGGCVIWGTQLVRGVYLRSVRRSGITVHNGEYRALVENLEHIKQATTSMLAGHKLTADILGSMVAKQESMASILDGLQCRLDTPQPTSTCALSIPSHTIQQQKED